MHSLKKFFLSLTVSLVAVMGFLTFLAPTETVSAGECKDNYAFLSFPKWYRNLCEPNTDKLMDFKGKNIGDEIVWPIVLNITDILLQVAGIVAAVFVIINGIMYILARGNQEKTATAMKGIGQAVVGLVLAVLASTIVGFVVYRLTENITTAGVGGAIPVMDADEIIRNGLNLLYWLVGIIAVVMIVISSFQYLTSRGFEDKALAARRTLLGSLIGLALVLFASFITNLVINLTGG